MGEHQPFRPRVAWSPIASAHRKATLSPISGSCPGNQAPMPPYRDPPAGTQWERAGTWATGSLEGGRADRHGIPGGCLPLSVLKKRFHCSFSFSGDDFGPRRRHSALSSDAALSILTSPLGARQKGCDPCAGGQTLDKKPRHWQFSPLRAGPSAHVGHAMTPQQSRVAVAPVQRRPCRVRCEGVAGDSSDPVPDSSRVWRFETCMQHAAAETAVSQVWSRGTPNSFFSPAAFLVLFVKGGRPALSRIRSVVAWLWLVRDVMWLRLPALQRPVQALPSRAWAGRWHHDRRPYWPEGDLASPWQQGALVNAGGPTGKPGRPPSSPGFLPVPPG
jgi:hypothetical protein